MTTKALEWHGDEVLAKVRDAVVKAIDVCTSLAALRAQELAPRDTGHMANTIEFEKASRNGNTIVGRMGNWTADYTLWNEIGTRRMPPRPFLRPAADSEFPNLPERIQRALKGI